MDYQSIYEDATKSDVLSKELISALLETQDYNNYHFINWAIKTLSIIKIRIERGDKITDAVSGIVYDQESFKAFVEKNFSNVIVQDVYKKTRGTKKYYFQIEKCGEGEYHMVLAEDGKQKTFEWISSLSEKFSLVYMISTGIVYIKNIKQGTYNAFLSENGKNCRYNPETGKIYEVG